MATRSCISQQPQGPSFINTGASDCMMKTWVNWSISANVTCGQRGEDGGYRGSVRTGAVKSTGIRFEAYQSGCRSLQSSIQGLSLFELNSRQLTLQIAHQVPSKTEQDRAHQESLICSLGSRRPLVASHRAGTVAVHKHNLWFDCRRLSGLIVLLSVESFCSRGEGTRGD